jgi:hypothetical protein
MIMMGKRQASNHAKDVVRGMLWGRCCPDNSDVDSITDNPEEQEIIIIAVNELLDKLAKQCVRKA